MTHIIYRCLENSGCVCNVKRLHQILLMSMSLFPLLNAYKTVCSLEEMEDPWRDWNADYRRLPASE